MAICLKVTALIVSMLVFTQLEMGEAKPMSYSYNRLLELLKEALIQRARPQPWQTHLQYNGESRAQQIGQPVDAVYLGDGMLWTCGKNLLLFS